MCSFPIDELDAAVRGHQSRGLIARDSEPNIAPTSLTAVYEQMAAAHLPPVTLNVERAVGTALEALTKVEKFSADIQRECPSLPQDLILQTADAAHALCHAEALRSAAVARATHRPSPSIEALRAVREHLVADAKPLVTRGRIPAKAITLSPGNSPRKFAADVLKFVETLSANIHYLDGRSLTTLPAREAAALSAEDVLAFLREKQRDAESIESANLTRQRALVWFLHLYEELRWALRFVRRRSGDADLIAPSVYTVRRLLERAAPQTASRAPLRSSPGRNVVSTTCTRANHLAAYICRRSDHFSRIDRGFRTRSGFEFARAQ